MGKGENVPEKKDKVGKIASKRSERGCQKLFTKF